MKIKQLIVGNLLLPLILLASPCFAQDDAKKDEKTDSTQVWETTGSVGLTLANVGLENWAGGGVSSVSVGFVSSYKANRETENAVWNNQFDFAYGLLKQRGNNTFRKTDDQLIIQSQLGYKLSEHWLISGLLNFRTQISPGYEYGLDSLGEETRNKISNLLAPGYLTVNTGITYKIKKVFTATLAPLTVKNTFVMDDEINEVSFGLEQGNSIRSELGINFSANLNKKVMENVTISSGLALFANYKTLGEIDVNWEALLSMKVNKYINASFGTQLIYDQDIEIDNKNSLVQFKHALNIGIGITF